jgi:hypothetical protein
MIDDSHVVNMFRDLVDEVVDEVPLRPREVDALVTVGFYFSAFVLAALVIADMLAEAWESWGLTRHLVRGTLNLVGLPPAVAYYVPTGLFFGVLTALWLDTYKRKQGLLLWLGVLGALLLVFVPRGIVVGLVSNFTWIGFALGVLSFVGGLRLAGVTTDHIEAEPPHEYPRAPLILLGFLTVVAVLGWGETLLAYRSPVWSAAGGFTLRPLEFEGFRTGLPFVVRTAAIGVGVVALRRFTEYEREFNVLMIGPQRSGKTAAFGGFHAAIGGMTDRTLLENSGTMKARDRIRNGYFPRPTTATDRRLVNLQFVDDEPFRFPEKVKLQSVDYAGEKLDDILSAFVDTDEVYDLPPLPNVHGTLDGSGTPEPPLDDGPVFAGADESVATDGSDRTGSTNEDESEPVSSGDDDGWGFVNEPDDGPDPNPDDRAGAGTDAAGWMPTEDGDGADVDRDQSRYEPASSWEAATVQIDRVRGKNVHRPIQDCLRHADRVVLTVPLDDLVGPVIERGNDPPYYDTWEEGDGDLAGQLWTWGYRRQVGLKPVYRDDRRHYVVNGPTRTPPWQYLAWYRQLVSSFDSTDFVVVCTMSDWAVRDFKRRHTDQQGAPANPIENYDAFRRHVYEEVLRDWLGVLVEDIHGGCDDDYPHLLWYSIENDETPRNDGERLRIETEKQGHVLNCADQVVDRLAR